MSKYVRSSAFRDGWDRIFGSRKTELKKEETKHCEHALGAEMPAICGDCRYRMRMYEYGVPRDY